MVKFLLDLLTRNSDTETTIEGKTKLLKSTLSRIGIRISHIRNKPPPDGRLASNETHNMSATDEPACPAPRKSGRSKVPRAFDDDGLEGDADSSQQDPPTSRRNKTSTEFLGYRRLHLSEIVNLDRSSSIIVIIPSNQRREEKTITDSRDAFRDRVISYVMQSMRNNSEFREIPKEKRREEANKILLNTCGIKRNQCTYIELSCSVSAYPHREDYMNDFCSEKDVKQHVEKGGAGLSLDLLQFPNPDKITLRWSEINHVQIWQEFWRGDERPQIELKSRNEVYHYANELTDHFTAIQDDYIQMLELRLDFESRKCRVLERKLREKKSQIEDLEAVNQPVASEFAACAPKEATPNKRFRY